MYGSLTKIKLFFWLKVLGGVVIHGLEKCENVESSFRYFLHERRNNFGIWSLLHIQEHLKTCFEFFGISTFKGVKYFCIFVLHYFMQFQNFHWTEVFNKKVNEIVLKYLANERERA